MAVTFERAVAIDLLGTGKTLDATLTGDADPCNVKVHTITLEVTDSDGNVTREEIALNVQQIC